MSLLKTLKSIGPEKPYHGLSDQAKGEVKRNFLLILIAQLFSKLADTLASAKIVLPWVMSSVGAPTFLTGLLVPIRESGSLLPQVLIGGRIQALAKRKHLYVFGILVQASCIALVAVVSVTLEGMVAGISVVGLLCLFSLARGVCSLTSKDVLGKTIPESNRGRLMGISASLSGLIGIGLGLALFFDILSAGGKYWMLLTLASACWMLTAGVYASVREFAGETEPAAGALEQITSSFQLLRDDRQFRHFVIVRALMMSSSLSAPYFVLIAQQASSEGSLQNLGMFIVISGVASFLSSSVWGRFADQSSRKVLLLTSLLTMILCLAAAGLRQFSFDYAVVWAMVLFFCLSITHQGVRLGRKTYVVDLDDGNARTHYVSTSNSVIGALLLVTGVFGAIAAQFSITWVLILFAVMALMALILGWSLPEATQE